MDTTEDLAASVVVPTFNRCGLLRQTVASLCRQRLSSCEFCIVDDGSSGETLDFLKSLPAIDPRFRLLEKPSALPRGCQASKNFAIRQLRGRYVVFLDSDDLISPECLIRRAAWLDAHPEIDMAVGEQAVIDENAGKVVWLNRMTNFGCSDLDRLLHLTQPLDIPWVNGGVTIRSARLRETGVLYRPEFRWEDAVFHFECVVKGLRVAWMPRTGQPDSFYRLHGRSMGSDLWNPEATENVYQMLMWMESLLERCNQLTESRRRILARNLFHLVVLRAADQNQFAVAHDLLRRGRKLVTDLQFLNADRFLQVRRMTRWSKRLTWWTNQFIRRTQSDWFPKVDSTWGLDALASPWHYRTLAEVMPDYVAACRSQESPS